MYKFISKLRSELLVFLTHHMALPFLRVLRRPPAFPYDGRTLSFMQKGSLGNDLYAFLKNKDLHLLPYYAKHDIKHVLLEYDTTGEGEVCLQCFMLGNRHISFPVAATVIYGLLTMPEHWSKFKEAYKRGRSAPEIRNWKWFDIITEETAVLKKIINQNNNYETNMD